MLGTGELIIIFLVVLLLFGGKKLPELARSLGAGIREFKKASQGLDQPCEAERKQSGKPIDIDVTPKKPEGGD